MGTASDTPTLGSSGDPIEGVLGGGLTTGGGGGGGGGILSALGGLLGGGGSSGGGSGGNQQLLNTVLGALLQKQQPTGFGGSFVGGPGLASGRAQAPAFGPPAIEGGSGRATSPLERLALAMAALR